MTWGQFFTHDVSLSPTSVYADGTSPVCCTADGLNLPPEDLHPQCLPIQIPSDDPFYKQYNQSCMNFVRTQIAISSECSLSYAQQVKHSIEWIGRQMSDLEYNWFVDKWKYSLSGRLADLRKWWSYVAQFTTKDGRLDENYRRKWPFSIADGFAFMRQVGLLFSRYRTVGYNYAARIIG